MKKIQSKLQKVAIRLLTSLFRIGGGDEINSRLDTEENYCI